MRTPACPTAWSRCGDGVVGQDLGEADEGFEACDDGNEDDTDVQVRLHPQICGDGVVGLGEGCDDGNQDPDDECDECRPKVCGDGSSVPESSAMTAT